MSLKLGVNIDHIATLRQARRSTRPDPLDAAAVVLSAGANYSRKRRGCFVQIVCQAYPRGMLGR